MKEIQIFLVSPAQKSVLKQHHYYTYHVPFSFISKHYHIGHTSLDAPSAPTVFIHSYDKELQNVNIWMSTLQMYVALLE